MIEDYFAEFMATLNASPAVRSHEIVFDKRDRDLGYIRGNVFFVDSSLLHVREFVNTESGIDRFMYAYRYQRADGTLVFRYDNTAHYPDLPNAPHHKHLGESRIVSCQPPICPPFSKRLNRKYCWSDSSPIWYDRACDHPAAAGHSEALVPNGLCERRLV